MHVEKQSRTGVFAGGGAGDMGESILDNKKYFGLLTIFMQIHIFFSGFSIN